MTLAVEHDVKHQKNKLKLLLSEIQCDPPPVVANSRSEGTSRWFGSVVVYSCLEDFGLSMDSDILRIEDGHMRAEIVCQQDSQWSKTLFTCECEWFSTYVLWKIY